MGDQYHVLKTLPGYFDAVVSGAKTFEIRRNDRGFQTGDYIQLVRMHDSLDSTAYPEGRSTLERRISYVFSGDPALGPQLGGVAPGYVVLGLEALR